MTLNVVGPSLMEVWTTGGLLGLIENTPENYAEWVACCCVAGCGCIDKCDSPFYRFTVGRAGIGDPGAPWTITALYEGNLTEQDPSSIPGDPVCCEPVERYWTATIATTCSPTEPEILLEVACCPFANESRLWIRINGVAWFGPTNGTCIDYHGSQALGFPTDCNGTPSIEVWCDNEPAPLTNDLPIWEIDCF